MSNFFTESMKCDNVDVPWANLLNSVFARIDEAIGFLQASYKLPNIEYIQLKITDLKNFIQKTISSKYPNIDPQTITNIDKKLTSIFAEIQDSSPEDIMTAFQSMRWDMQSSIMFPITSYASDISGNSSHSTPIDEISLLDS